MLARIHEDNRKQEPVVVYQNALFFAARSRAIGIRVRSLASSRRFQDIFRSTRRSRSRDLLVRNVDRREILRKI